LLSLGLFMASRRVRARGDRKPAGA
jgi:hypothetical protein